MAILKVTRTKVGPSPIVQVDMDYTDQPVLPGLCPCCGERTDQGAFIVAECPPLPPVPFPACAPCAKHSRVEGRMAKVLGPGLLGLTVLLVAAFLFVRGMNTFGHPEAGLGWRLLAGLSNLRFPFMGPVNAGVTLLGGGLLLVALLLGYRAVGHLLFGHLTKASCRWFNQAARMEILGGEQGGKPWRRYILENPAYAAHFIKANGGEP